MTQHRFADELECSYSSIQGYEGGRNIPDAMLEKLAAIARSNRLPDLAEDLAARTGEPSQPDPSPGTYSRKNKRWHDMLEAILDSGDQRTLDAVESNLAIFYGWVTEQRARKAGKAKR